MASQATLNLRVLSKRMMTADEAAYHCGRTLQQFKAECPVAPIKFGTRDLRYDVRDLDTWIDSLKDVTAATSQDAYLARL